MLSASTLGLMTECPRCFWLRLVKHVDRPSSPFPSLPGGIDRIMKARFDAYRSRGELPEELSAHGIEAKLFSDGRLISIWRSNRAGLRTTDVKSGVTLMGAVDDILEKDGELIVLDFKTRGYPKKEDTAGFYMDQLSIYNMLLRRNGYATSDYGYLLFLYPMDIVAGERILFRTEVAKVGTDIKAAEELFARAIALLAGGLPEPSPSCGFCSWARAYASATGQRG